MHVPAQNANWAVYAIVMQNDSDLPDPCDIRYCILQQDSSQNADKMTSTHFVAIYQRLNYANALQLRNLHCPDEGNVPDQVIKFSSCELEPLQTSIHGKQNLIKKGLTLAKKEIQKRGVLFYVGQGARGLADSGIIKDEKVNRVLKSVSRVKVKIPIRSKSERRNKRKSLGQTIGT